MLRRQQTHINVLTLMLPSRSGDAPAMQLAQVAGLASVLEVPRLRALSRNDGLEHSGHAKHHNQRD